MSKQNKARFPGLFYRIQMLYAKLPPEAQGRVDGITCVHMEVSDIERVLTVFDDYTCHRCCQIGSDCQCPK